MTIIARSVWGAKPASLPSADMRLPATTVFIHHSVTPVTDDPYKDMRAIESVGLQRFGQFSYSYCIHPRDGEILEGCGLKRGAHTAQRNSTSFGICWIGNYEQRAPKVQQIEATRWLVDHLTDQGYLIPGAEILPHRSVYATACPGSKLVAVLDAIRVPYAPPAPPPDTGIVLEVDVNIRAFTLMIPLDGNGKGWAKIPYPIDRVLSTIPHSGTRPGADGRYDGTPDVVGATPEDDGTIVVVQGGEPGGQAPVSVRVIEN